MNSNPFLPGTKICAYLRDSGGDEQDLSTAQQEHEIRHWAFDNQLIVVDLFVDAARPGSSVIKRLEFMNMIQFLQKPTCDAAGVVVWSLSRFSRDMDDAQYFIAGLRRTGKIVFSLSDNIPEGIHGRFMESALQWQNAMYLENLSKDIKRGVYHNLSQHGALGGRPPKGFKREEIDLGKHRDGSDHKVHRWVPDPENWEFCRIAWLMRAEGKSYEEINKAVHLYGSLNSYNDFFRNKLYTGILQFGEEIIENYCVPMVDQATWDEVQKLSHSRAQNLAAVDNSTHPRRYSSNFILSGLLYCARCSSPFNGRVIKFKDRPSRGYYRCSGKARRRDCDMADIPQEVIEPAILKALTEYILEETNLEQRWSEASNPISERNVEIKRQISAYQDRLAGIKKRTHNLLVALEEGGEARTVLNRIKDLDAEEIDVQTQIMNLVATIESPGALDMSWINQRLLPVLRNADREDLRSIYHGMLKRITIERLQRTLQGNILYIIPEKEILTPAKGEDFMPTSRCPWQITNHRHNFNFPFKIILSYGMKWKFV